ncbi:MFS transporter [Longispora albida]|uniref:MFS transporter n=1 Tax=Longispora albida TaxID=203523 RepID=UPI00036EDAA3|nr:MFS transporter [Longispora albida]
MASPLRLHKFRLLLSARVINTFGSAVAPIALAFAVLDLTGSATDLGLVVGTRMILNVIFLLYGGIIADRLPRHLILVGSSALSALTQGAIAALILTHSATIPLLVALAAVNGVSAALTGPASGAIVTQVLPAECRQQGNAILRFGHTSAMVVGAPLGGLAIAYTSPGWGVAADAMTFAISGALFAILKVAPAPAAADRGESTFAQLRTGWREFIARDWLWSVVLGFMVMNAAGSAALMVLGPVLAKDTIGVKSWGLVLGAETAGMAVGALIAMRLRVRRLLLLGVVCTSSMALIPFALAFAPRLVVLVPVAFFAGVCIEQFGVAWETTMQEHVPEDMLARMYSYDMLGSFMAIPIGQMTAGPIADVAGISPTLAGLGAVMVVAALAMLIPRGVRTLRTAQHTVKKATEEPVPAAI